MATVTFSQKTIFPFVERINLALDALATVHTTPAPLAHELGDLARMQLVRGRLRAYFKASASGQGVAELRLMAGAVAVKTVQLDMTATDEFEIDEAVNLNSVTGAEPITIELEVTTAAAAAVTGDLSARLDVEVPAVILG